jgi:hypothetical protein
MACCGRLGRLLGRIANCCGRKRAKVTPSGPCPTLTLESNNSFQVGTTNPVTFTFNTVVQFVVGTVLQSLAGPGSDCGGVQSPTAGTYAAVGNTVSFTPNANFGVFDYQFSFTVQLPGRPDCTLDVLQCQIPAA